ncbi:MAG: hypothetical protein KA116_07770, partial [Proteobacteria bacterium]|nr:hypothetical protein [Pseudomonadota bacterium]
ISIRNIFNILILISINNVFADSKDLKTQEAIHANSKKRKVANESDEISPDVLKSFEQRMELASKAIAPKLKNLERGSERAALEAEKLFKVLEITCNPEILKKPMAQSYSDKLVLLLGQISLIDASFYSLELCEDFFKTHSDLYLLSEKKLDKAMAKELAEDVKNFHRSKKEGNG